MPDVQDTSDYKLSKSGRKVRAHKIVFNKGEEEQMKNPQVNEVLSKDDPASKWIKDFVHSDNPKFEGKSKKKRINMALGAYYGAQRGGVKEDVDMEVVSIAEMIDRVRETLDEEQDSKHFEIYDTKTSKPLHTFKAKHMSHANIKADDWLESQGKTGKGLKVRPAKQGVAEGSNSSPFDQMADLKSKSNKELDELVRFWQRSLEKNPNHKVANDQLHLVKMIRAERIGKKGVKEEVELDEEQLDELKKSTLMRYASKATKSAIGLGVKAARARDEDDMATWAKNRNKAEKRDRNVQKAIAKIRSEEVEQLDEIGDTPAGKRALRAVQNRAADTMSDSSKTPKEVNKAVGAGVSAGNRLHGFGHDRMKKNTVMGRDALRKQLGVNEEVEQIDEVELVEAVQVSHDRYMRSHQKMASGKGNWMFTHKRSGDVNYRNDSEVHQASGSFADAKKSAKMWAQKHGHSTVYVME